MARRDLPPDVDGDDTSSQWGPQELMVIPTAQLGRRGARRAAREGTARRLYQYHTSAEALATRAPSPPTTLPCRGVWTRVTLSHFW
jgi:hypothetical protein